MESKVHVGKYILWVVEVREKILSLVIRPKLSGHITKEEKSDRFREKQNP